MDWDVIQVGIGLLSTIGIFVLALQKQRVDRPLAEAQTGAATMANVKGQVDVIVAARHEQDLIIERQNTQIEKLRGDMALSDMAHQQAMTALRAETETKLSAQQDQNNKLQQQLAEANATIGTLTKRITDLEALLIVANKETVEAKQESADKADPVSPPALTLPSPLPITIVEAGPEEKSP